MTERIASAAARRPGRTIAAWMIAVLASIVLIVFFLGDALSGEAEQLNNPESQQAYDLIQGRLPPDPNLTTDVVVARSASSRPGTPGFNVRLAPLLQALRATDGVLYVGPQPAAQSDELDPVLDRDRARCAGRGVLAEAVAGDEVGS